MVRKATTALLTIGRPIYSPPVLGPAPGQEGVEQVLRHDGRLAHAPRPIASSRDACPHDLRILAIPVRTWSPRQRASTRTAWRKACGSSTRTTAAPLDCIWPTKTATAVVNGVVIETSLFIEIIVFSTCRRP